MRRSSYIETLGREQTEEDVRNEIAASNVICLVYAVDDEKSIERVGVYVFEKEVYTCSILGTYTLVEVDPDSSWQ